MRAGIVAAMVAALGIVAGCGGSPKDLGTIEPRDAIANVPGPFTIVEMDGFVPSSYEADVHAVEIDPDGTGMWIYFAGGNTGCHAVAGVDVVRHDPQPPVVTVRYGTRMGVLGCTAEGTLLAIHQPLDPPFPNG